jgi:hypothetical protein
LALRTVAFLIEIGRDLVFDDGLLQIIENLFALLQQKFFADFWPLSSSSLRIGLHICPLLLFLEGANPLTPPQNEHFSCLSTAQSRIQHYSPLLPSGLLGPVQLIRVAAK